jgi:glycosyltransferase involved in cell wall biosynthesis
VSSRRIAIVTTQLLGFDVAGGVGAATTSLALALARSGHDIDVLYVKDRLPQQLDPAWARRYEEVGARVRHVARSAVSVEPPSFWRLRAVERALRDDPPDVVIAHEYGGPAYIAQRLRQLGLGFQHTLFVTYCHGTGPWMKEVTGNALISPAMLAHAPLEQAAVELADVIVSPSAYLLGWMTDRRWRLPEARVIPLLTRATATSRAPSRDRDVDRNGRVERLVYFGRLEDVKGIGPFVAALNTLPPQLLEGVHLEFLGGRSKHWDPTRVTAQLSDRTKGAFAQVSFETELGRDEALARLDRPGTLAVMPSLAENSPNVVYECLEHDIPFLASTGGGIGELVATEDRERVLFEPTVDGISTALQRALTGGEALRSVRPAFDPAEVLSAWEEVVATDIPAARPAGERPLVDVVRPGGAVPALDAQTYERTNVIRSLQDGTAEWVVFLDDRDMPLPEFVDVLVRAQAASRADVVSCALVHAGHERYFLGDPGGVGVLQNGYGTAALIRRALLPESAAARPAGDADWPLLAQLSAAGARIVSVPMPLLASERRPGTLEHEPANALLVVAALERALPDPARLLARLAAGLAAEKSRQPPSRTLRGRVGRKTGGLLRSLVGGKAGGKARSTP